MENDLPKNLEDVYQLAEELRDEWHDIAEWCESVGLEKEGAIVRRCIGRLWSKVQEPVRLSIKEND